MFKPKPEWLKIKVQSGPELAEVEKLIKNLSLNTVCEEANCPNRMECFSRRTATFMILGRTCTRNCSFCNVEKNNPQPVDKDEPFHVAQAVKELQLKHVVVTSVTRDDLPDGGASHFSSVVNEIRKVDKKVVVEVLIPDFNGSNEALMEVVGARPDIINHNVETVPRLYSSVRPMAAYRRSLLLLNNVKEMDKSIFTKSGIMLGLGENEHEVVEVFRDLRMVNCDFLTVGQYLAPSKKHQTVIEYIHPEVFEKYRKLSLEMGFKYVAAGPLVRSSYQADRAMVNNQ